MAEKTITDLAELRIPRKIEHAWAQGDAAAFDGASRDSNPYPEGPTGCLHDIWDLGWRGFPLDPENPVVAAALLGRHDKKVLDHAVMRTMPSLRAQFGYHRKPAEGGRHRDDREASPLAVAA